MNDLAVLSRESPTKPQPHYLLAICYIRLGLTEEALPELREAIKYSANDPKPTVKLIGELIKIGRSDEAAELTSLAHQKFPTNNEISFWQANLLLRNHYRNAEVEFLLNQISLAEPNFPGLKLSLAKLRANQSRFPEALKLAQAQLLETPHWVDAQLFEGMLYMHMRDYNRGYPDLKNAYNKLVFAPSLASSFAQAAYWTGHYEEMIEPAIVAMSMTTDRFTEKFALERQFEDALKKIPTSVTRAIIRKASDRLDQFSSKLHGPSFHRTLAKCLADAGMHDLAITELRHCVQLDSNDALAYFALAKELEVYSARYDEALACYRKAKILAPSIENLDMLIDRLQERITSRQSDLAWCLKDWVHGH
jgi:tetratricopeptide (TPR) repeat protein